jgi:hypothetical protein
MPEDPQFTYTLELCKLLVLNTLYDSKLTQVENKGGKTARKTAHELKKCVQQESEKVMLFVRLLLLADKLGRSAERAPAHIAEFNRLIPQVLRNLKSIREKRHLAEILEARAVIGCRYCLQLSDKVDLTGLYCSKKCHKAALDRSAYLARQARDRKIKTELAGSKFANWSSLRARDP